MKTYQGKFLIAATLSFLLTACGDTGVVDETTADPTPPTVNPQTTDMAPPDTVDPMAMIDDGSSPIDFCDGRTGTLRLREDRTLTNHRTGTDYIMTCTVEFLNGTLTIDPGVEVEFSASKGLYISDNATIRALGGYENGVRVEPAIVFKGNSVSGQPSWNGIMIDSNSIDNYLENVDVIGAGFRSLSSIFFPRGPSALLLDGAITIKGLTVDESGGHGIYTGGSVDFGQLQDVVIAETVDHPLITPTHIAGTQLAENVGNITFTSTDTDNFQSIGLFSEQLNFGRLAGRLRFSFENHQIPYFTYDGIFTNGEIPIDFASGTEFIVAAGKSIRSGGGTGSRFRISGTAEEPVTFRGAEALAGYWGSLTISSNTVLNTIQHVIIEDATNGIFANSALAAVQLFVMNSTINNTSECGIRSTVRSNALFGRVVVLSTSNNIYSNNGSGDLNDPLCLGNFEE